MVEILPLDYPANVVLLPGATQHWRDLTQAPVTQTPLVRAIVEPYIPDGASVLVVGAHSVSWLREVAARTAMTVVVRCIPDATEIGRTLDDVTVYCGDPAQLPRNVTGFDVVIAATDLARVLPLESEARPWVSLYTEVAGRVRDGGVVIVGIENDLGLHRLNGPANPRSSNTDSDWAPLATWDASRPRTSAQVSALGEGLVWALYPEWEKATVGHVGELAPELAVSRDAAVLDAAVWPLFGPDPVWYLQSAAASDRTADWASGWLAIMGAADAPVAAYRTTAADTVAEIPAAPNLAARGLLGLLSDALASHDLPAVRTLLKGWAEWVRTTNAPASLGTVLIDPELLPNSVVGSSLRSSTPLNRLGLTSELAGSRLNRVCSTIGVREDIGPTPWQALAQFVAIIRGRGWRVPWPSPTSDEEMLALLGAMAELGELSADELAALIVEAPRDPDALRSLDRQELIALISRANEQLAALRSRLRWNELQFVSSKLANRSKAAGKRGVRFAKRGARKALTIVGLGGKRPADPAENKSGQRS